MPKDKAYHEAAIEYNDLLVEAAESIADRITHPEIKKWPLAVAAQHRFHSRRHVAALEKLTKTGAKSVKTPKTVTDEQPSGSETEEHYRDAGTGQYVTEEYAEEHPDTTVEETDVVKEVSEVHDAEPMDLPVDENMTPEAAEPVDAAPDASEAAEPVDAGVSDEDSGVEVTTVPSDENEAVTSDAGVAMPEEEPEASDAQDSSNEPLPDGCVGVHKPGENDNCFFNPNRPTEGV